MTENLDDLRQTIDAIDTEIIRLFAARFRVTEKVGWHKKEQNLPIIDKEREARQMGRVAAIAESQGLDPEFAKRILRMTIDEAVSRHRVISGTDDESFDQTSLTERIVGSI